MMLIKQRLREIFLYRLGGGNYWIVDTSGLNDKYDVTSDFFDAGGYWSEYYDRYIMTAPNVARELNGKWIEKVFGKDLLKVGDRQSMAFVWLDLSISSPEERPSFICGIVL